MYRQEKIYWANPEVAAAVLDAEGFSVGLPRGTSSWPALRTARFHWKRRQEIKLHCDSGREVLKHYSVKLINRYAEIAATGSLLFYSLFVMTEREEWVLTIPLVIYGLFRYWYVVETLEKGESPTDALLEDPALLITIVLWIVACITLTP